MSGFLGLLGNIGQVAGAAENTYQKVQDADQRRQLAALSAKEAQQRLQQNQMQMQKLQQQMQQDAQQYQQSQQIAQLGGLALQGMGAPGGQPGGAPQGVMPGGPTPMGAGQPSMPGGGGGAPQGGAMPPAGGSPQGGMPGQPAGSGQGAGIQSAFGPPDTPQGYSLGAMARGIKKINPQADDGTVFQTVVQLQHLLAPNDKFALQQKLQQMKVEGSLKEIEARSAASDKARKGDLADTLQIEGVRHKDALELEDRRYGHSMDRIDENNSTRSGKNPALVGAKADYDDASAELQDINNQINTLKQKNGGFTPGPTSPDWKDMDRLLKARNETSSKRLQAKQKYDGVLRQGRGAAAAGGPAGGGGAPTPGPQGGASQDAPAKPSTQEDFDALPSGAYFVNPSDGRVLQKK